MTQQTDHIVDSNKKVTAVDLLVKLLPQIDWDDPYYRGVWQQAKQMEKEQIINAHDIGYEQGYIDNGKDGETYYNETYGSE